MKILLLSMLDSFAAAMGTSVSAAVRMPNGTLSCFDVNIDSLGSPFISIIVSFFFLEAANSNELHPRGS